MCYENEYGIYAADGFGNIELLCRDFCEKERVRTFYGMGAEESWNNDGICFLECV